MLLLLKVHLTLKSDHVFFDLVILDFIIFALLISHLDLALKLNNLELFRAELVAQDC